MVVTLVLRPFDCKFCDVGYLHTGHISSMVKSSGHTLVELAGVGVEKENLENTIAVHKPRYLIGLGHGSETSFTGNSEAPILTASNIGKLKGASIHLLSCRTGASLANSAVNSGVTSYFGYGRDWTWVQGDIKDPWTDRYARPFYTSDAVIDQEMLSGRTSGAAFRASEAAYKANIDRWYKSGDQYAMEVVKWLLWDKASMTFSGDPDDTIGAGSAIFSKSTILAGLTVGGVAIAAFGGWIT